MKFEPDNFTMGLHDESDAGHDLLCHGVGDRGREPAKQIEGNVNLVTHSGLFNVSSGHYTAEMTIIPSSLG